MRPLLLASTCFLMILGRPADAQTAAEMQSHCKPIVEGDRDSEGETHTVAFERTFESGLCWGAFAAVQGTFRIAVQSKSGRVGALGPCVSSKATRADLIRVFSSYLDKHLDRLSDDFFDVVYDAIRETYPHLCK